MLDLFIKLFFLYLPFQIALNPTEGVDLASVRVIIPVLFLIWLLISLKNRSLTLPYNLNLLLIGSFLFLCIFSLFFAENTSWGIRKLLFFLSIFPLFFVLGDKFYTNPIKRLSLLKYTVWGALGTSSIAITQFLLQFIIPLDELYTFWAILIKPFLGNSFSQAVLTNPSWLVNIGGHTILRATAFFPDPHMLSFYLNITALISLGIFFYIKQNKFSNYTYLIIFSIITLANLLTFSRGGYLGLIAGLLFFSFFIFKNNLLNLLKSVKNISILAIIFLLIILFFIIPNPIASRLNSSFNLNEGSNIGRLTTWKQSLEIINKNPVWGTGLGNYSLTVKPSADYREPIYAHNTFLDIAAETGFLNSLIWLCLIIFNIITFTKVFAKNNNSIYLGLAASLVAFLFHSFFETAIFSVHILPLIVLIFSLNNFKHNE